MGFRYRLLMMIGLNVLNCVATATDLETRVDQLERLLNGQVVLDREQQWTQMQNDIQRLQGTIEVLNHRMTQLEKQQREMYLDIDQRLQSAPVSEIPPTLETTDLPDEITAQSPEPTMPVTSDEEEIYHRAFNFLQQRQYKQAITAFNQLLLEYPQGQHVEDAQYWLAETFYTLKEYDKALDKFGKFLEKYPKSLKYAHAQLKIGYIYYELADYVAARAILEQVKTRYPNTTTAHLAQERLQLMQKNGL